MTQVQKLQRRNLIFAGVAVLLLAFLLVRAPETSAVTEEALPKLLPDLQVDNVRALVLEQDGKRVELRRKDDDAWVIATAHDYPATATKVNALLEKLLSVRRRTLITRRAETFGEYAGADGWVSLQALDALGKPLASFAVGKTAKWPDAYVRVEEAGVPLVVRAANLQPHDVRTTLESWSEARLWPDLALPDVSRIDVFQKEEGRTISFVKKDVPVEPAEPAEPAEGEEGAERTQPSTKTVWVMVAPEQEGEQPEADTFKVEGLIRSFTGMRFTDIAGGGAADAATGLAEPAFRVNVSGTAPGVGRRPPTYTLEVGAAVPAATGGPDASPDGWYVRRGGDPFVFTVASYAIGDFRKPPEEFLPEPEPAEPAEPAPEPMPGALPDEADGSPDGGTTDAALPGGLPPAPLPVVPPADEPKDEPEDPPKDPPKDGE